MLGMDVKEIPSVSCDAAYDSATAMGVGEVSVSLGRSLPEPWVGVCDAPLPPGHQCVLPASKWRSDSRVAPHRCAWAVFAGPTSGAFL